MRAEFGVVLAVLTALLLSGSTTVSSFGLPAPSNVTITCDDYGVVVGWKSSGPNAGFLLTLIQDRENDTKITRTTTSQQYNISELLQDTGYNVYYVEVKARDGEYESQPEYSKTFSFNARQPADLYCNLTFPPVDLTPGEWQLFVSFRNPLQLYRNTPALRNLNANENLRYFVTSKKEYDFECAPDSDTCEANVTFPEEQEEYCVTLRGWIRQTIVQKTDRLCYRGSLKPRVPVIIYFIPLFVIVLSLALICVAKAINRELKKKSLSKLPEFLQNKIPNMDLFMPLRLETETVVKNPQIAPVTTIPDSCDSSGTSSQLENFLYPPRCPLDEGKYGKESGDGELEEKHAQGVVDNYSNEAEMSTGGLSEGYDRPHALIEMSPGDNVEAYGPRGSLIG